MERHLNPSLIPYTQFIGKGALRFAEIIGSEWKNEKITINDKNINDLDTYIDSWGDHPIYSSVAVFRTDTQQCKKYDVVALTKHIIDIDSHGLQENISEQEAQQLANYFIGLADNSKIPTPSTIIYSGRGCHIVWNLKNENQDIELWEETQKALIIKVNALLNEFKDGGFINLMEVKGVQVSEAIQHLTVDNVVHDTTRITRVCNSYNDKAKAYSKALFESKTAYTQEEFIEKAALTFSNKKGTLTGKELIELYKKEPQALEEMAKGKKAYFRPVCKDFSKAKYRAMRLRDMLTLVELRNARGYLEGYRNDLLIIAGTLIREGKKSAVDILNELQDINERFKKPVSQQQVNNVFKLIINTKGQRYYKSNTIIETLGISDIEQEKMSAIIGLKEKKRRDRTRKALEYAPIKEINQKARAKRLLQVKSLREQGATVETIAALLNTTMRTVFRDIAKLKELNML